MNLANGVLLIPNLGLQGSAAGSFSKSEGLKGRTSLSHSSQKLCLGFTLIFLGLILQMKRLCALPIPDGLQAFSNTPFSLPGAFPGCCREKSASRGQPCLTSGLEPLATWAVSLGIARVDGELENTFLVRPWHPSEHRQSSPFPECWRSRGKWKVRSFKDRSRCGRTHTSSHLPPSHHLVSTRLLCVLACAMHCAAGCRRMCVLGLLC